MLDDLRSLDSTGKIGSCPLREMSRGPRGSNAGWLAKFETKKGGLPSVIWDCVCILHGRSKLITDPLPVDISCARHLRNFGPNDGVKLCTIYRQFFTAPDRKAEDSAIRRSSQGFIITDDIVDLPAFGHWVPGATAALAHARSCGAEPGSGLRAMIGSSRLSERAAYTGQWPCVLPAGNRQMQFLEPSTVVNLLMLAKEIDHVLLPFQLYSNPKIASEFIRSILRKAGTGTRDLRVNSSCSDGPSIGN